MKVSELVRVDGPREFLKHAPLTGPRIIVADVETFPMLSFHWRMWKQNISPLQVVEDVSMMSYAVKWLGSPITCYNDNRGMGIKRMRNDKKLLVGLHAILSNVDAVVAQNGKRFDLPIIKGRMAINGMQPIAKAPAVIDTLLHNKNEFAFSANSLAFLSPKFADEAKLEHKEFPGFNLWLECLKDNPAAWDECELYNVVDITSLEEMYMKLRGWYNGHFNYGPYIDAAEGTHVCPNCGSDHVHSKGLTRTQVGVYRRYICRNCGKGSRGRYQAVSRQDRAHVIVN